MIRLAIEFVIVMRSLDRVEKFIVKSVLCDCFNFSPPEPPENKDI